MAHPEGQLLDAGGSLVQESDQTCRARVCFVGHRCICMSVLVWVRSVLLKQVRSLSPLPADVRALPRRLRARGRVSFWVLLNQKMFPPGNTHSVSRTSLVLAESETIRSKFGHLASRSTPGELRYGPLSQPDRCHCPCLGQGPTAGA